MKEFLIAASLVCNPTNSGDRTPGIHTEQRLEINKQGLCNTITTVLKDNYVIEIEIEEDIFMKYCIECGCIMPDDHDSDMCEICQDERDGTLPDSLSTERG